MKKEILGFMFVCLLFVGCVQFPETILVYSGTVQGIAFVEETFLETEHYVVLFENDVQLKISASNGALPQTGKSFNVFRNKSYGVTWYTLESTE